MPPDHGIETSIAILGEALHQKCTSNSRARVEKWLVALEQAIEESPSLQQQQKGYVRVSSPGDSKSAKHTATSMASIHSIL